VFSRTAPSLCVTLPRIAVRARPRPFRRELSAGGRCRSSAEAIVRSGTAAGQTATWWLTLRAMRHERAAVGVQARAAVWL